MHKHLAFGSWFSSLGVLLLGMVLGGQPTTTLQAQLIPVLVDTSADANPRHLGFGRLGGQGFTFKPPQAVALRPFRSGLAAFAQQAERLPLAHTPLQPRAVSWPYADTSLYASLRQLLGRRWGVLDSLGRVVLPPEYTGLRLFPGGQWLALLKPTGLGLADRRGNLRIPCLYRGIRLYASGRISILDFQRNTGWQEAQPPQRNLPPTTPDTLVLSMDLQGAAWKTWPKALDWPTFPPSEGSQQQPLTLARWLGVAADSLPGRLEAQWEPGWQLRDFGSDTVYWLARDSIQRVFPLGEGWVYLAPVGLWHPREGFFRLPEQVAHRLSLLFQQESMTSSKAPRMIGAADQWLLRLLWEQDRWGWWSVQDSAWWQQPLAERKTAFAFGWLPLYRAGAWSARHTSQITALSLRADTVVPLPCGLLAYRKNSLWTALDSLGERILPWVFDSLHQQGELLAATLDGRTWYYQPDGRLSARNPQRQHTVAAWRWSPPRFVLQRTNGVSLFSDTLSAVRPLRGQFFAARLPSKGDSLLGQWGLMDLAGKWRIPPEYDSLVGPEHGLVWAYRANRGWRALTPAGEPLLSGWVQQWAWLDADSTWLGLHTGQRWRLAPANLSRVWPTTYRIPPSLERVLLQAGPHTSQPDTLWLIHARLEGGGKRLGWLHPASGYQQVPGFRRVLMPQGHGPLAVQTDQGWGYAWPDGRVALQAYFDSVSRFTNGLAAGRLRPQFLSQEPMENLRKRDFRRLKANSWILMDSLGVPRHPESFSQLFFSNWTLPTTGGRPVVWAKRNGAWYALSFGTRQGRQERLKIDQPHQSRRPYLIARKGNGWTLVDTLGDNLLSAEDTLFFVNDSLVNTGLRGGNALRSLPDGALRVPPVSGRLLVEAGGVVRVCKRNSYGRRQWGLEHLELDRRVPPIYDSITPPMGRAVWARRGGTPSGPARWSLYATDLTPVFRNSIQAFHPDTLADTLWGWRIRTQGGWGLLDHANQLRVAPSYQALEPWRAGYYRYQLAGKWGLLNPQGVEVLPPLYQDLIPLDSNRFKVRQNGKWGLVNARGLWLVNPQFDALYRMRAWPAALGVRVDDRFGVLGPDNSWLLKPNYTFAAALDSQHVLLNIAGRFREKNPQQVGLPALRGLEGGTWATADRFGKVLETLDAWSFRRWGNRLLQEIPGGWRVPAALADRFPAHPWVASRADSVIPLPGLRPGAPSWAVWAPPQPDTVRGRGWVEPRWWVLSDLGDSLAAQAFTQLLVSADSSRLLPARDDSLWVGPQATVPKPDWFRARSSGWELVYATQAGRRLQLVDTAARPLTPLLPLAPQGGGQSPWVFHTGSDPALEFDPDFSPVLYSPSDQFSAGQVLQQRGAPQHKSAIGLTPNNHWILLDSPPPIGFEGLLPQPVRRLRGVSVER